MYHALEMQVFDLPATLSHARRRCVWLPADASHHSWDGRAGLLRIDLWHSRRWQAKQETAFYIVQVVCQSGGTGFGFYLLKENDPTQEDVYLCQPHLNYCSCKAATCKVPICRHRDALAAVVEAGGFDLPALPDFDVSERCGSAFHVDEESMA